MGLVVGVQNSLIRLNRCNRPAFLNCHYVSWLTNWLCEPIIKRVLLEYLTCCWDDELAAKSSVSLMYAA